MLSNNFHLMGQVYATKEEKIITQQILGQVCRFISNKTEYLKR